MATSPEAKHRDGKKAIVLAAQACKLSNWKEANHLNTLAAAYAEASDFAKAVEWQEKTNYFYLDAEDSRKGEERLKLYKANKPYRDER